MVYTIVLVIHYIALLAGLMFLAISMSNRQKLRNPFVIVATICSLISVLGYIFELIATDSAGMLMSVKIGYFGKCFLGDCLLMGFAEHYNWKIPRWIKAIIWFVSLGIFGLVLTCDYHGLFYASIGIVKSQGHYFFASRKAIGYILSMIFIMITYLMVSFYGIINYKSAIGRDRRMLRYMIGADFGVIIVVVVQACGLIKYYDVVPIMSMIVFCGLGLISQNYRLFGTDQATIDGVISTDHTGYIITNENNQLAFINEDANRILNPLNEVKVEPIVDEFLKNFSEIYEADGRIYRAEKSDIIDMGKVVGHAIKMMDITESEKTNREMKRLKDETELLYREKTKFIANISYKIKTPINAILKMNETILEETKEEKTREYAENILDAGDMLKNIVSDVMDYSRIDAGNISLLKARYEIKKLILEVARKYNSKAQKKQLKFMCMVAEDIPTGLVGDENRVKQLMSNLLINALKYTHEGSITLSVSWDTRNNGTGDLIISVEDTGIGIREDELDRMFKMFRGGVTTSVAGFEGAGLGLTITKQLLDLMKGSISVQSNYGIGSVFSMTIPQTVYDRTPIGKLPSIEENSSIDDSANENKEQKGSGSGSELKFVDVDAGMALCENNKRMYLGLLRVFVNNGASEMQKIRNAMDEGRWHDYAVIFHSIRGTCDNIGANRIANKAAEYEHAALEEEVGFIIDNTRGFLEEYTQLLRELVKYLNDNKEDSGK